MDRREAGEELYRKKFVECGLGATFDFIKRDWNSDHGRKMIVRCKSCGSVFSIWNEVFKGRQSRMYCKECGAASDGDTCIKARSPRVEEAMRFYSSGHSTRETADLFGFSKADINNFAKQRKISNGRDFRKASVEDQRKRAGKKLATRLLGFGFELVSDYGGIKSHVTVRCVNCGMEYERSVCHLKDVDKAPICIECQKRETQRKHEEQAEAKRLTDEIFKLWNPPKPSKNAYAEQHERFLLRSGVCEICGKPYTVREYVESCALKKAQDNGVCSRECRDEKKRRKCRAMHKGRKDTHRHRAKKYGCEYDPGVTLKKLVARDGLECKICGQMCDWDDHSWSKYSGPLYPSIDHIVPMSKGGGHIWENVRVTHIICNSEKGDRIEEVNA